MCHAGFQALCAFRAMSGDRGAKLRIQSLGTTLATWLCIQSLPDSCRVAG